jgi:hypothetical protein
MSGCAVGADGKLLDAKDIQWFEDADSSEPINLATTSTKADLPSTTIHPFFRGGPAPAAIVAGARRSGRATRPSNKLVDPDNAEASSSRVKHHSNIITDTDNAEATSSAITHKHKASRTMVASHCTNCKVAIDVDVPSDGSEMSEYEFDVVVEHPATSDIEAGDTEPDEDTDIGYATTKAMGDADREVSLPLSL